MRWVLVAAGGLLCATVASAAPPCLRDVEALCPNVPANGWLIQECLWSHEADLSKECLKHVDDVRRNASERVLDVLTPAQRRTLHEILAVVVGEDL